MHISLLNTRVLQLGRFETAALQILRGAGSIFALGLDHSIPERVVLGVIEDCLPSESTYLPGSQLQCVNHVIKLTVIF